MKNIFREAVLIMMTAKILHILFESGSPCINGYKILLKVAQLWPQHNIFHNGLR